VTNQSCTIIGSGIAGLTTALKLNQAGWRVTMLERQAGSHEASWAGGGILCPLYAWRYPAPVQELAQRGMALYEAFSDELKQASGIDPEYHRSGMMILDPVREDDERPRIDRWLERSGTEAQWTAADTVFPGLNGKDDALWMPGIANVRNPRLLKAMRATALERGVRIEDQHAVRALRIESGHVTGVELDETVHNCDCVVVAAGAWSAQLVPGFTPAEVFPVRGQMLRLAGRPPHGVPTILMDEGVYLIPRLDGGVIVGSTVEHAGFDKHTTEVAVHRLHRKAISMWPDLDHAPITHQWAGLRPGSRDELPYIGAHPTISGLYLNTGHYRNGLAMAPAIAEILADQMRGRTPTIDPVPFDPARAINDG